jgi:NAD(P)-dependent dehydrogenase (short-subunit alcohol dehydrogenase family)
MTQAQTTMPSVLDQFRLDGRVAIVTGATSGLGIGFARALAHAGADLVLAARRENRLADTRKLAEAEGRRAITIRADISDPDDCAAVVAAAKGEFSRVDILVNTLASAPPSQPPRRRPSSSARSSRSTSTAATGWPRPAGGS